MRWALSVSCGQWPGHAGSGQQRAPGLSLRPKGAAAGTHTSPQVAISPDAPLWGPCPPLQKGEMNSAAQVGAVMSVPRAPRSFVRRRRRRGGHSPPRPGLPTPSVTPPRGQLPPQEALKAVFQNHRRCRFLRSFLRLRAGGHPHRDPRESRRETPGRFPRSCSPGDPAAVRPREGTAPRPAAPRARPRPSAPAARPLTAAPPSPQPRRDHVGGARERPHAGPGGDPGVQLQQGQQAPGPHHAAAHRGRGRPFGGGDAGEARAPRPRTPRPEGGVPGPRTARLAALPIRPRSCTRSGGLFPGAPILHRSYRRTPPSRLPGAPFPPPSPSPSIPSLRGLPRSC